MQSSVHAIGLAADQLDDVDLTASGPVSVAIVGGHHPNGRPDSFALGKLGADFDAGEFPVAFVFGAEYH